jgi:site-specific DNA-adenine methylase
MYYPGNKAIPGLLHKIVNQIPVCNVFFEPFAGSAAVSKFLSVLPGIKTKFYINDLDPAATVNYNFPAGTKVTTGNGFDIINKLIRFRAGTGIFVFIDPPYHHSTRPDHTAIYKHEFSHDDHLRLLSSVLKLKCNCMIIHPVCDLYDQALHTFRTVQLSVRYHNKTSIEKLYMNYPWSEQLLTYVLTGKDCWDRQRIKRKGDRLIQKLSTLPAAERNYIISRILQSFSV